jgi:four helix bundle protein
MEVLPGAAPLSGMTQGEHGSSRDRTAETKNRTKHLAVGAILLSRRLPRTVEGRIIVGQLVRSATSIAANYRAVCRSRSRREFTSKLSIVVEECDETLFWLELVGELGLIPSGALPAMIDETGELLAMFVAARKTMQRRPA